MPVSDGPPHSLLGPPLTFSPCWAFVLSSFFITCFFVFLLHFFVSFRLFLSNRAHASFFCPPRLSLLVGYVPTATLFFLFLLSFFVFPFLSFFLFYHRPYHVQVPHLARPISSQSPSCLFCYSFSRFRFRFRFFFFFFFFLLAEHPSPTGLLIPSLVLLSLSLLGLCSLFLFISSFFSFFIFLFHFVS